MKIKKIKWNSLSAVQVDHHELQMVIVTEFGPRISFFGMAGGRNLLFWDSEGRGRKDWLLRGGHRVWVMNQGADENELTYSPDNDPCHVEIEENYLIVRGEKDKKNETIKGIKVTGGDENSLKVSSFIENAGDLIISCGVWVLTCTLPSGETTYEYPLGDDSGWDTFKSVQFRKWGGCDGEFGDSQFAVSSDKLTVTPCGRQAKQAFLIPKARGVMIVPEERLLFEKRTEYREEMAYPMDCNNAVYIGPDNYMVEFETMGPIKTLKPGTKIEHVEEWTLKRSKE